MRRGACTPLLDRDLAAGTPQSSRRRRDQHGARRRAGLAHLLVANWRSRSSRRCPGCRRRGSCRARVGRRVLGARICDQSRVQLLGHQRRRAGVEARPISMCLTSTVTVLSGAMRTNALASNVAGVAAAAADAAPAVGSASAEHRAPISQAGRTRRRKRAARTARRATDRVSSASHGSALQRRGRVVDRGADAHIGGAAADVARHRAVDVGVGRLRDLAAAARPRVMICPDWQ